MKTSTLFKVAAQSIGKNKLRTLLTMLGIVIGVGAVIVMVAIGNGAQTAVQKQISSLGTNLIIVMPGSFQGGGVSQGAGTFSRLTVADADKLKRDATLLAGVSPVVSTRTQVIGGQGNWRTLINGVSLDYLTIRDWSTTSGEFFSDADVRSSRKVAVIGTTVADNLFAGGDPVGAQIQIGKTPFTVVGVLAKKGQNAGGMDQDDVILVPYTTAQTRLSGNVRIGQILAIGHNVRLRITGPCGRCVMTTLAQGDLPQDTGILRTAAQHNRAIVGVYASVLQGGKITRHDAVRVE